MSDITLHAAPRPLTAMIRWCASASLWSVPTAAAPIAFAFLALQITGDVRGGAAMVLVMTLAGVVAALPLTRLGRRLPPVGYFRALVLVRASALLGMMLAVGAGAPLWVFLGLAAVVGSVHGAAYGVLRALLTGIVAKSALPRALGISVTLNELIFVLAPVAMSLLGGQSPALALGLMALFGGLPAVLVPLPDRSVQVPAAVSGSRLITPPILLWLACTAIEGFSVAMIEVGAVALALHYDHPAQMAILFTVPLCVASMAGGVWTSVRNKPLSLTAVCGALAMATCGAGFAAFGGSVALTILGVILIGLTLAPLATFYSLVLDTLAAEDRRPEVFALQRTAYAVGIIGASGALTLIAVADALQIAAVLMMVLTALVSTLAWRGTPVAQ